MQQLRIFFALVGGLVNLFLAILVIYKNRHNIIHRIFLFLSIILSSFNFSLLFYYLYPTDIFWKRMVYINASIMPVVGYHFFIILLDQNKSKKKIIAWIGYIIGMIFMASVLTPVFINYHQMWSYIFIAGMFPFAIYGIFLLYQALMATSQPMERIRLKYLILGASAITFVGALDLIFVKLLLSSIANTFYSVLAAYAIIKHRLMDITLLTRKIITVIIMAILISILFFASIFFAGKNFNTFYFSLLISIIITILIYQPLKDKVVFFLEQKIFKEKLDYQNSLYEFSNNMNRFIEEKVLIEKLVSIIAETMNITNAAVWILENDAFILKKSYLPVSANNIIHESSDVIKIVNENKIVIREEIERYLLYEDLSLAQQNKIKSAIFTLKELNLEAMFLMFSNNFIPGFLAIGKKTNGNFLSANDIKILQMLTYQAASCIENIRLQKELYKNKEIILLGKLAGGIAHEVKNPLGSIKGAAQYLKDELKENNLNVEFADIIVEEADRLNNLISEFLQFARPTKLEKKNVNINSLLVNILKIIQKEEEFKKIEFKQTFLQNLPLIKADDNQLKQVLYNIIINAGQAAGKDGIIEIATALEFNNICIYVKDNGKGIPSQVLPNIFEPFFTTKEKGTGLGLTIAKQIISQHNGKIEVESSPGNTRFMISLAVEN